jgi:hypothetical protein
MRWLWPAVAAALALGAFIFTQRTPEPMATDKAADVVSGTDAKLADMASAANAKVTDALTSLKASFTAKDVVDILSAQE